MPFLTCYFIKDADGYVTTVGADVEAKDASGNTISFGEAAANFRRTIEQYAEASGMTVEFVNPFQSASGLAINSAGDGVGVANGMPVYRYDGRAKEMVLATVLPYPTIGSFDLPSDRARWMRLLTTNNEAGNVIDENTAVWPRDYQRATQELGGYISRHMHMTSAGNMVERVEIHSPFEGMKNAITTLYMNSDEDRQWVEQAFGVAFNDIPDTHSAYTKKGNNLDDRFLLKLPRAVQFLLTMDGEGKSKRFYKITDYVPQPGERQDNQQAQQVPQNVAPQQAPAPSQYQQAQAPAPQQQQAPQAGGLGKVFNPPF